MNLYYPAVSERAGHRCEYCRAPEAIFNFPFEVEHILPTSRGGVDDESNFALACRSCNLRKGNHLTGIADGDPIRPFHPRADIWEEHFQLDAETAEIRGVSQIGRATVARLGMNSPEQIAARLQWMRLGLFP